MVSVVDYWQTKQASLLTGSRIQVAPSGVDSGGKVEMEFAFDLEAAVKTKKGRVILIDADGNKHQENVDFSKIFR